MPAFLCGRAYVDLQVRDVYNVFTLLTLLTLLIEITILMGRLVTSGIKARKRTTIYLTDDLVQALDLAHIQVQKRLNRRVDRTLFLDALLKAGLRHPKEIQRLIGEC